MTRRLLVTGNSGTNTCSPDSPGDDHCTIAGSYPAPPDPTTTLISLVNSGAPRHTATRDSTCRGGRSLTASAGTVTSTQQESNSPFCTPPRYLYSAAAANRTELSGVPACSSGHYSRVVLRQAVQTPIDMLQLCRPQNHCC